MDRDAVYREQGDFTVEDLLTHDECDEITAYAREVVIGARPVPSNTGVWMEAASEEQGLITDENRFEHLFKIGHQIERSAGHWDNLSCRILSPCISIDDIDPAIREADYQINPNSTPLLKTPSSFDFFHDKKQQKYISNQVKMYSAQAEGMGRLLFQSDSRLLFRSFSKSD